MSPRANSRNHIGPASPGDLPAIRAAYEAARILQERTGSRVWPAFDDQSILADVAAERVFCVFRGEALAGVFTMVDADPIIWGELERGAHLYLHRIARAAGCTVNGLFDVVLRWARLVAQSLGKEGIRMDTWASNAALIEYYKRHGFILIDRRTMPQGCDLPPHYYGTELALLEKSTPVTPTKPLHDRKPHEQSAS